MNEDYKRTIDRINHSTNEKIRSLHDDCSREMVNYMRSHSNAPETEIRSEIERITHKYNQGLHHYIAAGENEYRTYIGQYISRLSNVLGRDVNISYNTTGISQAKENIIREASDSFRENLNRYALSVSHRTLSASIEEEVHTFNTAGNELSSARSSSVDDIERLCSHITRASTTEGYMTISSLIGDIPEVMGYEVDVSPTDKYGRTRTVDICDHMKGEYPKDFKFTGWHPNCRCVIHPIIPDDMMTPALKAAGFIGRPRGSKITPPREALEYVKANRDKNPKFFDQFNAYRQVEHRGMPRTYMDMSLQDKLSFHIEDLSKITGKYLADLNQVEINITDDLPDDVFMSTVPKNGSYQISMRPSQAEDLSQVFSKRGLALPLTHSQIEVSADALHELTHSCSYDYTFGQSIEENVNKPMAALREKEEMLKNQNLSPEELEKEKTKIKNQKAKIDRNRNIIIDYHHGFDPLEVGTLEMITEWEMRESFPGVMKQLGLTLPPDYAQYIKRGYNEPVSNFNLFINRIPADNIEAFRRSMHEILTNPDKAFTQQRLQAAIKKSGALLKGSRPSQIVTAMQMNTPQEFEILLDNTALPPTRKAADVIDVDYTDVSSHIHNQGVSSKTLKNITRGTLAAGAVSVISSAAGSVIDPNREYSEKRYIPETFYKDSYVNALLAGIYDRAVNSVEDSWVMAKDLAIYAFYNKYMPFSSKTRQMHKEIFSTIGEIGEFMYMYQTNIAFKLLINNILIEEIKNYLGSLWGTTPSHGYALGQLLFDVVSMFFGPGEIRAVLTGFKTTKTGIAFQRVIKTNLDTFFELIDKYFKPKDLSPDIHKNSIIDIEAIDKAVKKTGQYIKVNAYKAEKKIDKLIGNNQPATTNKAPQVSSLITSNADEARQIVESIDNVLDNHVKNIDNIIENPQSPYVKFSGGHTKK
ncbi:MAG: hypothetical protein IIY15_01710, partial [Flavobacteriales bacterium]|nr:hypothetical protein [Flavobacteriales bacterium]